MTICKQTAKCVYIELKVWYTLFVVVGEIMEFKRASSSEQKELRRNAIIDSGVSIFLEDGYSAVNFGRVAQSLSINRTVIYNYFSNPADILLGYLSNKLSDLTQYLVTRENYEVSPLLIMVQLVNNDNEFQEVVAIVSTILEPESSSEHCMRFRKKLKQFKDILRMVSIEYDPLTTNDEFDEQFDAFIVMFIGIAAIKIKSKEVIDICIETGAPVFNVDLFEMCYRYYQGTRHIENGHKIWKKKI